MQFRARRNDQTYGYNVRQQMRYNRYTRLTNRGIDFYNAYRPTNYQTTYNTRYKQIYGQKQVYRPQYSQQPTFRTGQNRYYYPPQGPSLPQDPLRSWHAPYLRYEQQNKDWSQYQPFTQQWTLATTKPKVPYYYRPTSLTRKTYRELKWWKQAVLPKGQYNYDPYVYKSLWRKTRFWIARHIPWGTLTDLPEPTATDDLDTNVNNINKPCYHWDERLQKKVPCSKAQLYKKAILNYQKHSHFKRQYTGYTGRRLSRPFSSKNTRYNRRGSRSYSRFNRSSWR